MSNLVMDMVDLVDSYERRVSGVDNLIFSSYETPSTSDDGLARASKTREDLTARLRETLARNCSLRRKDFERLAEEVFADIRIKSSQLEKERIEVRDSLKAYLKRQKDFAVSLKDQLLKCLEKGSTTDDVKLILSDIKRSHETEGEELSSRFRNFQLHLEAFRCEQEKLNQKLERLLEKGELLSIDDLRQVVVLTRVRRRTERNTGRSDVKHFLADLNTHSQRTTDGY
jgi:hypothetical protein